MQETLTRGMGRGTRAELGGRDIETQPPEQILKVPIFFFYISSTEIEKLE